jgi:hypothetical protein
MKKIRAAAALGAILFALGAFAIQNPTAPSGQTNPPQQTAPPSQQAPPAQTAPPQGAPPQGAPPQGAPQPPQPPSIDEQVTMLTHELNLTGDQPAKLKSALEDQRSQAMTVIGDGTLSREDKIQKVRGIREATITKVRGFLNDDQKKKLDQMLGESPEPPHSEPPHPKEPPQNNPK